MKSEKTMTTHQNKENQGYPFQVLLLLTVLGVSLVLLILKFTGTI